MPLLTLSLGALALGLAAGTAWWGMRLVLRLRGPRLVTCPETRKPVAVALDVRYSAVGALSGRQQFRLRDCSRWPERAGCGQECLSDIEAAPDGCLVRNVLAHWYAGRTCIFCERPIGEIHWHDHRPALRQRDGTIREWGEVRPEEVPEVLATHAPVCAHCSVTEGFRREHPDMVVERPGHLA